VCTAHLTPALPSLSMASVVSVVVNRIRMG
jgi:hypothetical protein